MQATNIINTGMENMDISGGEVQTMDKAHIPQDMYINNNPSAYPSSSSTGYIPIGSLGSNDNILLCKPKKFLNEDSVRRGVLKQYNTNNLEVPPSSTVPYTAVDGGIVSPKLMRSTMYRVPQNYSIHQSSKIPMGLIVQPLADIGEGEVELPTAEWATEGPVRWTICGGYVNPGTMFLENGTKAKCNFCGSIFPVSDTKYSFVTDKSTIPELYYGSYEFNVCGKYCYYDAVNPIYVFIIDVSNETSANSLFANTISIIQSTLDSMPNPLNTQICILWVDDHVHCYNVPKDLEREPIEYQIWDIHDPFLPIPISQLLLNLESDRERIDLLLEKLPEIHTIEEAKFKPASLNLTSAYMIAYEILEKTGGRIMTFYSRLDNVGPGVNTVMDNHKLYNTDAEKGLFQPGMGFYNDLSK